MLRSTPGFNTKTGWTELLFIEMRYSGEVKKKREGKALRDVFETSK